MKKLKKMASKFFGAVLALAMALTVVPVMEIQANEEKMVTDDTWMERKST